MNRRVLSFTIKNSYVNARQIADRIVIGLMRFPNPKQITACTYSSSVALSFLDRIDRAIEGCSISDNDVRRYKIIVYRVSGNHGSILSPSQNEVFMNVVTNDDLVELMSKYLEEKGK